MIMAAGYLDGPDCHDHELSMPHIRGGGRITFPCDPGCDAGTRAAHTNQTDEPNVINL